MANPRIFVTFHETPAVFAIDIITQTTTANVLTGSTQPVEPRGIYLESGCLILLDGSKTQSTVYVCNSDPSTGTYGPAVPLISPATANSIDHPFAAAFDGAGICYVSNQDSNVVAGFTVDLTNPSSTTVNKVASYLKGLGLLGKFLKGTLVASAVGDLPGVSGDPPVVPESDGGLAAELVQDPSSSSTHSHKTKLKVQNSVRDIALVNQLLLVVDEVAGVVRTYDSSSGAYLGASVATDSPGSAVYALESPTHLLVTSAAVWITSANRIYTSPLPTASAPSLTFTPLFSVSSGALSGMAIDPSGNIYLANRTGKTVAQYPPNFSSTTPNWTVPNLPDQPEFLLYVAD